MEKNLREHFRVTHQDSDRISRLDIPPQPPQAIHSFYEEFNLRGIRLDRLEPGFVSCSFTVPPRLTDRNGNLAVGVIASLVDEIGASVIYEKDVPMNVSVEDERESPMEKSPREYLRVTQQDLDRVTRLNIPPQDPQSHHSFYTEFNTRGLKVDQLQPGFFNCFFTVPPRLTDRNGNLAVGAIAGIIDVIGATLVYEKDANKNFSVDMSISYLSTAKLNDELEISGWLLGRKGGYGGTLVVLKKKATQEIIAEGRHSLFGKPKSKI